MKTTQIGSFEAKTHFSELIRDVIRGRTYEILRRGKPVAYLTGITSENMSQDSCDALDYFSELRKTASVTRSEIRDWIKEGRANA